MGAACRKGPYLLVGGHGPVPAESSGPKGRGKVRSPGVHRTRGLALSRLRTRVRAAAGLSNGGSLNELATARL